MTARECRFHRARRADGSHPIPRANRHRSHSPCRPHANRWAYHAGAPHSSTCRPTLRAHGSRRAHHRTAYPPDTLRGTPWNHTGRPAGSAPSTPCHLTRARPCPQPHTLHAAQPHTRQHPLDAGTCPRSARQPTASNPWRPCARPHAHSRMRTRTRPGFPPRPRSARAAAPPHQ